MDSGYIDCKRGKYIMAKISWDWLESNLFFEHQIVKLDSRFGTFGYQTASISELTPSYIGSFIFPCNHPLNCHCFPGFYSMQCFLFLPFLFYLVFVYHIPISRGFWMLNSWNVNAVGNISTGFCCNSRSLVGILGGPQACPDWRWISGHKHCSICRMGHPYFGCHYDSSGFSPSPTSHFCHVGFMLHLCTWLGIW